LPDEEERIRRRCPPVVVEDRRRGRVNASATAAGPDGDDDASLDDDNGNEVAKQGDDDDDDDDEAREDDDAMARRIVDVVAVAAAAARIIVVVRITTAVRCPPLVVLIVDSELFFFVWLLLLSWVSLGVPVGSGGGSRHVVLVHHVFVDGPRHGMYGGDDGFGEVPSRVRISMIIRQNRSVVDIRDIMTPTVTPRDRVCLSRITEVECQCVRKLGGIGWPFHKSIYGGNDRPRKVGWAESGRDGYTRTSVILERFLIFPKSLELSIVLPFYFPNMSENSSNSISPLFGGTSR
jgi:hypothetical protein